MKDPVITRMEEDLKDLGRSIHTRRIYVQTATRLRRHFGTSLDELEIEDVQKYMRVLIRSGDYSTQTLGVYAAAIRFVFKVTLCRPEVVQGLRTPRRERKLPVIMSAEEVRRCLAVVTSERNRAFIMLAYGGGLRISEVSHMRVVDIESHNGVLRIANGKGRKERVVMLSMVLLEQLRRSWKEQRPEGAWLFPGRKQHLPLHTRQIRRVWTDIQARAGLRRYYPFHALRGAFATHLLDGGVDLRTIQVLLGHATMNSTARYIAVQSNHVNNVQSPLDRLVQNGP
jgi:site-specific recombinase XerD